MDMMPSSNVVERRDRPPIDIVVPVYNARDDLERCVASLLMHTPEGCRIVLIDDASPDPRIADYFASLETSADPRLHLLKNARNLGFTLTANRGMTLSRADVVLLNSDTIVTAGRSRRSPTTPRSARSRASAKTTTGSSIATRKRHGARSTPPRCRAIRICRLASASACTCGGP